MMEKSRLERERRSERELYHESVKRTAANVTVRDRWRVFESGCVYYCIYMPLCVCVCVFVSH